VSGMTIRILRAKQFWLTGATGQEQQPVSGLESLASPRNSINIRHRRHAEALRARGFKFVGPTICYAFMEATGMIDDHILACFRRRDPPHG
jgi:3-methyladenine DNA glycosylase Tag